MIKFRAIPAEKEAKDFRTALMLGIVTFVIYFFTLSPGAFPGVSAKLITEAAGFETRSLPIHPIFSLLATTVAKIPFFSLAFRLNLFSALCGSLSVALLYRVTSFFIFECIDERTENDLAGRVSWLSGLVAAVTLAFSLAFWQSATRLSVESFELVALLSVATLLVSYAKHGYKAFPYLFAFLCGVGIAESPIFIRFSPVFLYLAVQVLWKRRQLKMGRIIWIGWAALAGLATYFVVAWSFYRGNSAGLYGFNSVFEVVVAVWRNQYAALRTSLPKINWLIVLLLGVMPWVASMFAAPRTLNNERSWSHYIFHLSLTVMSVIALLNLKISPWRILNSNGSLPVGTYAMIAMVLGYLVGYWYILPRQAADKNVSERKFALFTRRFGNWIGLALTVPISLFALAVGVVNYFEANGHRGAFADACAGEILDRMGAREWIVTDGTLDAHLQILAQKRGLPLNLICLQKDGQGVYSRQLKKMVSEKGLFDGDMLLRMQNSIDLGVIPFLQDWFASAADINQKVVVFGVPDLWYAAGMTPFPEGLFFSGAKSLEEHKDLSVKQYFDFWDRMEKILKRKPDATERVAVQRNNLRRHMGFVANNLGVTLEDIGRDDEAFAVYTRVRKMDPENISALFNQFEMVRRGAKAEEKEAIEKDLKDLLAGLKHRYPLWSLSRYFGYVRSPEIFAQLGYSWAMSGQMGGVVPIERWRGPISEQTSLMMMDAMARIYALQDDRLKSEAVYQAILSRDPSNRQALISMARLSIQAGEMDKASSWLDKAQDLGMTSSSLGIEWAVVHLAAGDIQRARIMLQEVTDLQPKNLQAWAMLALVQLQQGDIADVEKVVLPKMESVAGTADHYFIQITKAQTAMKKGKDFYRVAREALIRAALLRPDVAGVRDLILNIDIMLNDEERAEAHARQILRFNRDHALANYVMGSLRLGKMQYGEAEAFLRRSVEKEPAAAALNDLAEVLRRNRRMDEAEVYVRQALKINAELYVAWETLGAILTEKGALDEAEKALDKSLALYDDDLRVKLSMARLQMKKGNLIRARELMLQIRKHQAKLPPFDQREFTRLNEELNRGGAR